jgi:hypothetical protein
LDLDIVGDLKGSGVVVEELRGTTVLRAPTVTSPL